ncbi:hypothetical protein DESC_720194 [Desulfosarcina cetonica]|nr:hypothetical protein DESC_720194 [Desulfosarcina cetonica]
MGVHDRLGGAGGAGGEHHGQVVMVIHVDHGVGQIGVGADLGVIGHVIRRVRADADIVLDGAQLFADRLHDVQKFTAQNKDLGFGDAGGEKYIVAFEPEIEGHDHGAQTDDGIVGDEPLQGVVLQMHHVAAVLDAARLGQIVGRAVDGIVERFPGECPALSGGRGPFDQAHLVGKVTGMHGGVFRVVHDQPPVGRNVIGLSAFYAFINITIDAAGSPRGITRLIAWPAFPLVCGAGSCPLPCGASRRS